MNFLFKQFKTFFVFIVDIISAFCALFLMLLIRYGAEEFYPELGIHLVPFSIIIGIFILTFYIFNLYSLRFNRNITELTNSFIKSFIISFIVSIIIFYIFGGFFELTPKTNLVIFAAIFGVSDFYLRILIKRYFTQNNINRKIILINATESTLVSEIKQNQNIGYEIIKETSAFNLQEILTSKPDLIVIDSITEKEFAQFYELLKAGIFVYTINNFYEEIFQKVPTEKIERDEIVDYISSNRTIFNFVKRVFDIVLSLILIFIFSPFFIIIPILIKITSRGPALFKHKRISLNDTEFTIYKFRSMYIDAEKDGAVWTKNDKIDPRITPLGRFMRQTHIDEIPQLVNILMGEISFVGPRPERPEFIEKLKQEIRYYDLRHSVKTGLTGWAQVNYKYGSSVEDAREKLRYDFYYIKNRTIFFDILIILKTIAKLFTY